MPLDINAHPIDWSVDDRAGWIAKHQRFDTEMDIALIAAHVRLLDLDSLDEDMTDEETPCPDCQGRGWFMTTEHRRPWRETKQTCWSCQS